MSNDEDKLIKQLSHFSIGTHDESLSRQLDSTYLTDSPTISSHPLNYQQQQQQQQQQQHSNEHTNIWPSNFPSQSITQIPSWQTTSPTVATNDADEEGWGDAPAYTSILQNTYFGFSSIMLPSHSSVPLSSSEDPNKGTVSLDPNQPFSRFSHQPVSFTSLTSPPSHDIFDNQ